MINQAGVIFAQFLHQFISSLPLSRCKNGKFSLRSTKFPLVCPSSSILNHKNYFLVLLTTIYERKNNTRDPLLDEGQTKLYWLYRSTAIFTFAQPDKKLKHHQRCCLAQFLSCIFVAQHIWRWVCHSVWWNILVRCQCKANNFSSRSSFVKPTLSWALLRYRLDFDQTLLSLLALLSWKQRQYGDVIAIDSPLPQNSMMLLLITRSRAWSFPNSKQTRRKANPTQKIWFLANFRSWLISTPLRD